MDLQGLKLVLAPPAWTLLSHLVRIDQRAPSQVPTGPCIFACLHRDILPAILYVQPARPALMVSHSPARVFTGEGGGRALVALRRELEAGHSVGVAVDGPKGPFGAIHEGVLHLARLTGAPIVPLRAVSRRALVLGTWDRTVVPLPMGGTRIEEGAGLMVGETGDQETVRRRLEEFFGVGRG